MPNRQPRQYWLMKSEPDVFGIDDLAHSENKTSMWEGVRNFEARNFMRDQMRVGDGILFYHSNSKPPHIAGTATVASKSYPDPTQFDTASDYFDKKATKDEPIWYLVDVKYETSFPKPIDRATLQHDPICGEMILFKRNRLSITPVTSEEWLAVHQLVGVKPKR
jgi:predicted RNA-binding protein with PUA-like domain